MRTFRFFKILLFSFLTATCENKNDEGFATTEELKEAFRTSFEEGDLEGLMDLVYWDDSPEEVRDSYETLFSMFLGQHQIDKLEVVPLDALAYPENLTGRDIEPVIALTHWLAVAHSGNTGFEGSKSTGTFQFAVGLANEKYYFSGIRFTDKAKNAKVESSESAKPTVEEYFDDGSWIPPLGRNEKLLKIVRLAPGEVRPLEGVIESEGRYGIRVKEAWDLKDRQDADGKDYWVYLRSPSSTPDRPNSVGTTFSASTRLRPGEGIEFELANETPLPVTVAIYSEPSEDD